MTVSQTQREFYLNCIKHNNKIIRELWEQNKQIEEWIREMDEKDDK